MKNTTLLFIVSMSVGLFQSTALAQEGTGPSITVGSYVADKYLAFGTGSVLSEDPVIQTDVFVLFKNGVYVDLWNSRSLKGSWDDGSFGNEVDYGLGWKGSVGKGLSLNIGATYFDEPRAFTLGAGDILYTRAFLTKECKLLSVTLGYENYVAMPGSGFKGGNLVSIGASKSWSSREGKLGMRASVVGVYDTGTIGTDDGFILRGGVGIDWRASKRLTFNLIGVSWFVPVTAHDKRTRNVMAYSGITWNVR